MDLSTIEASKLALLKAQSMPHSNSRIGIITKPINIRKMSTMEEESSEDLDTSTHQIAVMNLGQQNNHSNNYTCNDDSDLSDHERERGRLLSSGSRRIFIVPAVSGSNPSAQIGHTTTTTSSTGSGNGNLISKKSSCSRNSSAESFQDSKSRRRDEELTMRISRDNSFHRESVNGHHHPNHNHHHHHHSHHRDQNGLHRENSTHGRFNRGVELYGGRHRYPSMRSLKSNATEEHHQQPTTSWASISFSDATPSQSPARGAPFHESVSIRSLASIGLGSSDGRKLTIRRVPTSPSELLNMVQSP